MPLTKIIATISDKNCSTGFIRSLYEAGMNVARINTAHISIDSGRKAIENIRAVSDSIAIMIDTKGPEIRTMNINQEIIVSEGEEITISEKEVIPGKKFFNVNYLYFAKDVSVNDKILIDDGDIELTVILDNENYLVCRVENQGVIKNNKSINLPGLDIPLPALSRKDKIFIQFACENQIDFIAHSFVRSKNDILKVQKEIDKYSGSCKIIAKIENQEGVDNIEEILDTAYGIMVARGDLGIELPLEKIPTIQRNLVRKAILHKKPVIIATQMLHSMIEHPRPTRAEVSDVANAIYSRADAIMLSGETAAGKYPIEAVKTMVKIAEEVEPDLDKRYDVILPPISNEIPAYLAQSAIKASKELETRAVVTSTTTGRTARYLSAYRSNKPVYAKCHSQRVVRELALSFGIFPAYLPILKNRMRIQNAAISSLVQDGTVALDDMLVYVGGRFGEECSATFIEVATASNMMHANIKKTG